MKKTLGIRWVRALLLVGLLTPIPCFAQHGDALDVSGCFSNILVNKNVNLTKTSLRYAMLSVWNKELYEDAKQSGQLSVLIQGVPIGAGYDQSDQVRLKELYVRNEGLAYDNATASSAFWLDPQAGQIIRDCLNAQANRGFGLSSAYIAHDAYKATLQLYWKWAPANSPLKIRTKNIINARVTDDNNKHPKTLLAGRYFGVSSWSDFSSSPISLERDNPDEDIVITLETDPDIEPQTIVIPKVPPKEKCDPVQVVADPTGQPYDHTYPQVLTSSLPNKGPKGNGNGWEFTNDISALDNGKDGILSSVTCMKVGSPSDYMDLDRANPTYASEAPGLIVSTTTAMCSGWWQNSGRWVSMRVNWYKSGWSCKSLPWKQATTSQPKDEKNSGN